MFRTNKLQNWFQINSHQGVKDKLNKSMPSKSFINFTSGKNNTEFCWSNVTPMKVLTAVHSMNFS